MQEDEIKPPINDRRASSRQDFGASQNGEAGEDPPPVSAETSSDKSLEVQLAEERQRAEANLASWQRSAADFQNFKRRVEQEREELARFANAALMLNLLPLLDDLDRALENVEPHISGLTWVDGIRLIQRKFEALMEAHGVSEIEAQGVQFDPNQHEAVMFGDGEEGKVISVVQKGYQLGGRVLRPAMVVVGKAESETQAEA